MILRFQTGMFALQERQQLAQSHADAEEEEQHAAAAQEARWKLQEKVDVLEQVTPLYLARV